MAQDLCDFGLAPCSLLWVLYLRDCFPRLGGACVYLNELVSNLISMLGEMRS
jgi:hypothetical protein